jgi:hypothetical protein
MGHFSMKILPPEGQFSVAFNTYTDDQCRLAGYAQAQEGFYR